MNITATESIIPTKNPTPAETVSKSLALSGILRVIASEERINITTRHKRSSTTSGNNIITSTTMHHDIAVAFKSPTPAVTVVSASPSAVPTTGTKLPTKKRAVFMVMLSAARLTILYKIKNPENKVIINPISQLATDFILSAII